MLYLCFGNTTQTCSPAKWSCYQDICIRKGKYANMNNQVPLTTFSYKKFRTGYQKMRFTAGSNFMGKIFPKRFYWNANKSKVK
jgi:hypothetical protein